MKKLLATVLRGLTIAGRAIANREVVVGGLYGLSAALIAAGATRLSVPGGLIVGGVALAAWTVVTFAELGE